jgi:integrase
LDRQRRLRAERDTATRASAVTTVAKHASGGLRFHDLRHSYATWLVSSGVPINDVQKVMGHEQAPTTLKRYTHGSDGRDGRVRKALADCSLTEGDPKPSEDESGLPEEEA